MKRLLLLCHVLILPALFYGGEYALQGAAQEANFPQTPAPSTIDPIPYVWSGYGLAGMLLLELIGLSFQFRRFLHLQDGERKQSLVQARLFAMRPHFLLNALAGVQLAWVRGARAGELHTSQLAALLRRTIQHSQQHWVQLSEELVFVESYLLLEATARPFRFRIEVLNAAEPDRIMLPPLIAQPLLENSIRHAFVQRTPTDTIDLCFDVSLERRWVRIIVSDNGHMQQLPSARTDRGIGWLNIEERLRWYWGHRAHPGLLLTHSDLHGFKVEVCAPIQIRPYDKQDPHCRRP